ncbi:MAG: putative membrane protein YphA (DoxX/SURF4 family) [Planctomycetota bacterium]|jgi:uncharacterized membrane protein YphA (DoxX/SURF4 family)
MASASSLPNGGLVLIRIALGCLVTSTGWAWAAGGELDGGQVRAVVRHHLDDLAGPFAFWGDKVLLYNPDGLAFLVSWSVLIAGVCLLLGALTRPAGWLVTFLAFHLYLYGVDAMAAPAILLMAAAAGCAISRAGRRFGLDIALDGTLPSWITWVRGRSDFLS